MHIGNNVVMYLWIRLKWLVLAGVWIIPGAVRVFSQLPAATGIKPDPYCMDTPSYQLFLQINDFRQDKGLPGIPLSGNLSYVAAIHARDLAYNKPATKECGFHSWSARGGWSPCCFSRDEPAYPCMWNKPKELTGYKARGHEIIYWENDAVEPEQAMNQWRKRTAFNDMILGQGPWSRKSWKAVGTCVYKGFAIIWLGEETDWNGEPDLCDEMAVIQGDTTRQAPEESSQPSYISELRYYLIIASLPDMEKAASLLLEYQQKGFSTAQIITFDDKIRISLNDFKTYHQAKKAKASLGPEYQSIWILEH